MNSFEIRYSLLKFNTKYHTGVYAADQLKHITAKYFFVVVNSEVSSQPGLHWIAFMKVPGEETLEFFDSMGLSIKFYGHYFSSFIKKHGGLIRYNPNRIQSDFSDVCGNYCLYVINERLK
jgi:hypothetical protein